MSAILLFDHAPFWQRCPRPFLIFHFVSLSLIDVKPFPTNDIFSINNFRISLLIISSEALLPFFKVELIGAVNSRRSIGSFRIYCAGCWVCQTNILLRHISLTGWISVLRTGIQTTFNGTTRCRHPKNSVPTSNLRRPVDKKIWPWIKRMSWVKLLQWIIRFFVSQTRKTGHPGKNHETFKHRNWNWQELIKLGQTTIAVPDKYKNEI
jgi:hypothetical protein